MKDIHYVKAAIESPWNFGRTCQLVKGTIEELAEYFEVGGHPKSFKDFMAKLNEKSYIINAYEITEKEYEHKDYAERVIYHVDLT